MLENGGEYLATHGFICRLYFVMSIVAETLQTDFSGFASRHVSGTLEKAESWQPSLCIKAKGNCRPSLL